MIFPSVREFWILDFGFGISNARPRSFPKVAMPLRLESEIQNLSSSTRVSETRAARFRLIQNLKSKIPKEC
jgi:hypothetical protein